MTRVRERAVTLSLASFAALALLACADAPLGDRGDVIGSAPSDRARQGTRDGQPDAPEATPLADAADATPDVEAPEPDTGPDTPQEEACVPFISAPQGTCIGLIHQDNALEYPIVLAHGAGGFDDVGLLEYWQGIQGSLRDAGYAVYTSVVDPFNHSAVRGAQLAAFVDRVLACTCADKVNIIAHSQGGIDARYLVSGLGYGDRVASVTTIATPHHGTLAADLLLGIVPGVTDGVVNFFLWWGGNIYTDPLEDPDFRASMELMSTPGMEDFNAAYPDDTRVDYYSWAGRGGFLATGEEVCAQGEVPNPKTSSPLNALLLATWTALGGPAGVANDGLVAVESAMWGRFRGCIPADHLAQIGQPLGAVIGFDRFAFFKDIASFLVDEGH